MKVPFIFLFSIVLLITLYNSFARDVAFIDYNGEWIVIDEKEWSNKVKFKSEKGKFEIKTGTITFNVSYEDVSNENKVGFDDPDYGAARRENDFSILFSLSCS